MMFSPIRGTYAISLVIIALCLPAQLGAMEIIAHRGASADAPENTLSSMKLAWEQGADAIELDLWLSKDGKLVVFHDNTTKRFNGRDDKVPALTWDELQRVDVGSWKGERYAKEQIPTLGSILATIPSGHRAFLEIKCGPEILPELRRSLDEAGRRPMELAIISFNFDALRESKRLFPQIPHYFLQSYQKNAQTGQVPKLEASIDRCRSAGFDGLDLAFDWPIDAAFVAQIRAAGLKLFVWTVDDVAVARKLKSAGIDGITTNRPRWLRDQLLQN